MSHTFILKRATFKVIATLLIGFANLLAQAQETKVRFTLDWRFDGPSAIMMLPIARGYFKQEKLDVAMDAGSGSASAVQRIAAGTHDIGFADTSALVEFLGNNPTAPYSNGLHVHGALTGSGFCIEEFWNHQTFGFAGQAYRRPGL